MHTGFIRRILAMLLLAAAVLPAGAEEPLRAGCEVDYAPFSFVRSDGEADGFAVELLRETLKTMGRDARFKTGAFLDLKQDLAEGRLDVLPVFARTPEREALYDFTFPYMTMHGALVVRAGTGDIATPGDLKGKRVAVLDGDVAHEFLLRADLGAELTPLPSFAQALRELSEGRHDAVVIQRLLALQLIRNEKLEDHLRIVDKPITNYTQSLCFAVPQGRQETLDLLNEGLSLAITNGAFRRLQAKWFAPLAARSPLAAPVRVGGDHAFPPFEYRNGDGEPTGFNTDLTRAISREMNTPVEIRLDEWSRTLEAFRQGECDVIQGMYYSVERDQEFSFSGPYQLVRQVMVCRKDSPKPEGMAGKRLLVQKGDIMEEWARGQGYGDRLVTTASLEEALRRLAGGEADCVLGGRVQSHYWIKKNGWKNLEVGSEPLLTAEYCYAVRHGSEELLSIFSEGLAVLKETGRFHELESRWLSPYKGHGLSTRAVLKIAALVALPLLLLLLLTYTWSRTLGRQVVKRTEALREEMEASRRMAERLARTADELKRSNTDLEQFAYVISHDLKEPIRMVTGFLSLLQEQTATELDRKNREYMALAMEGGTRLQRLVDDLLTYSRVGHGKDVEDADAGDWVREALADLQGVIAEAGAEVVLESLPRLRANRTEIIQLFRNLVANAVKFRRAETPRIRIGAEQRKQDIRFFVKDNGIGIPAEYREKIFMIFERLHTSEEYTGTGIGLAICKKIVEHYGGRIEVESTPGAGSTFYFTLPLARP